MKIKICIYMSLSEVLVQKRIVCELVRYISMEAHLSIKERANARAQQESATDERP